MNIKKMENFVMGEKKEKKVVVGLLDFVFSWSIKQVFDKNLYKEEVKQIPDTFSSTDEYLKSFKLPLIEETRADFCSGLESVADAPASEISSIRIDKGHKPPEKLNYEILIRLITDLKNPGGHYEPQSCDVFAITNVRPRNIADLIRPGQYIVFAFVVERDEHSVSIVPSEELSCNELHSKKKGKRLFVTFVMNLTTNLRIWAALHRSPQSGKLGLLKNVLEYEPLGQNESCSLCIAEESCRLWRSRVFNMIQSFRLDKSQTDAVLSSISIAKCSHQKKNVKLIWGPPGTGKTKTVASLLFTLLKLKCRTLTCAPTNIAVVQVAERLVKILLGSIGEYDTYGLGDIVLFGNGDRMKIDENEVLVDVFLKYRLEALGQCLSPLNGWTYHLVSMIGLLENPRDRYNTYLRRVKGFDDETDGDINRNAVTKNGAPLEQSKRKNKKKTKENINKSLNGYENKQEKGKSKEQPGNSNKASKIETETMTFEEFVEKTFNSLARHLVNIAKNLYTHLPTSAVPLHVVQQMIVLINVLKTIISSTGHCRFADLMMKKLELLRILKDLQKRFPQPKIKGLLRNYCMKNAVLIFCTASGSIKVWSAVEMVIIDEAAQLKECESAIPLQVPGVRNALLIGDDRQLPAMVQSEVSGRVNFGRSLFQRLANLGKQKHLLSIQYRMHPTISAFPNKKFYENGIVDAAHVTLESYTRNFLKGNMYGSYSFINVSPGKEDFSKGRSPRNVVEAAVVNHIIGKLYSYHCNKNMAISVGVISPYKGQVWLMEEKFGKKYAERKGNGFTVNVRSVDGFQGGEEDIIIISTVRSNGNGSVGFVSNHQRTNVALTRARYCLWIVGNGSTLENSNTVWQDLVKDAKTRGCFFNADDVAEFKQAAKQPSITTTKTISKPDTGSLKLSRALWKVVFSDEYKASLTRVKSNETHEQLTELVHKLAEGWRQSNTVNAVNIASYGVAFELLELYKVDDTLCLAWSIDIQKEETKYTQVIKVWNVLSAFEIPKLAKDLNVLFGRYTVEFMNRCKHKSVQGNLAIPVSWPLSLADPTDCLSSRLANLNLRHHQETLIPTLRKKNNSRGKRNA